MEEKEIDKKPIPGKIMTFMLFMFLYGNIRLFFSSYPQMREEILDAQAMGESLIGPTVSGIFTAICFGLMIWSVIKMLRMDQDAIHTLRWAIGFDLVIVCCCLFMKLPEAFLYGYQVLLGVVGFILFDLILLRYLCKSSSIHTLYPKENRRKTPGLWVWLSYLLVTLAAIGAYLSEPIHRSLISRPIDPSELKLSNGMQSDGRILFTADTLWHRSDSLINFLFSDQDSQDFVRFHAKDNIKGQSLLSGLYKEDSANEYALLLLQIRPYADSLMVGEIAWGDTLINQDHCRYSQYLYNTSEGEKLWTAAIRYDHQSSRCCLYSVRETPLQMDSLRKVALDFIKAIRFCDKGSKHNYAQSRTDYDQQDISRERIPHKEYATLARIPESLLPSKPFGVMRTENQERRHGDHKQSKLFK